MGQGGNDRRPGRSDEFSADIGLFGRHVAAEGQDPGHWHRIAPVRTAHKTRAKAQGRSTDLVHLQELEADHGSYYVYQGVEGSHFVQGHFRGRGVVYLGFGCTQTLKDANGTLLDHVV